MKIWPFDQFVPNNDGNMIDLDELSQGTEPFRLIREKLKNKMEVMLELHSFWNLPSAIRIAKSVEKYNPFWIEDPIPMDNFDTLAQFKSSTSIPTTALKQLQLDGSLEKCLKKELYRYACLIFLGLEGCLKQKRYLQWQNHIIYL